MTIHTLSLIFNKLDAMSLLLVSLIVLAFLITWSFNRISLLRIRKNVRQSKEMSSIMQHTLELSKNSVLRLDLRQQWAYNLHGHLLPDGGLGYMDSFAFIHPDDRDTYRNFIMRLYHGEKTTDECIFRWDMSGQQHLGQYRYMHDVGIAEYAQNGTHPIHIFCTISDYTERIQQEQEERDLTDKYRKMFEQSIVGLAFYDKNGNLLNANRKMREILKFQSEEDPFYFDNTLYEMPTFRNVLTNHHVEELYFCTKSVIIERGVNCYTEMRLHPIYDDKGELYYITFSIRDVTQERELYLQNKKNEVEIHHANEAIQQYETELQYLMETCDMRFWRTSFKERTITFYKGLSIPEGQMNFDELADHFIDGELATYFKHPETYFKKDLNVLAHTRPFFHEGEGLQWNYIDSVPAFDEQGNFEGTYGLVRNVTPLIEKQEQLKEETERANDSGRLKSVFMANMTHEIRTPLNSIVGFSDILPMLTTPEEKKEIIRVIMNNCDMLLRLINDILAVSSLDAGGVRIEPRKVDFAKSFNDICESLEQRIESPAIAFIKENPYETFETLIDNGRIQQVITNFVTNAVKYTHQGHIKVGYRYEDGGLYIYCEDTGAGIPKEDQSKVFDRFVKLNDFIQGTGLGLSICKAIADGCHGSIGVDSEGQGQGSTFWIRIPCEKIGTEN